MIKIKKKVLKEAELAGIPATSTTTPPATSTEKTVDDAANTSMLRKFAQLPNSAQVVTVLTADFKLLTGDQKYKSLSQFLTSIGIDKATAQATVSRMQ